MGSAVEGSLAPVFFEGFLVGFGLWGGSCHFVDLRGVGFVAEESTRGPRREHVQCKLDIDFLRLVLQLQEDITGRCDLLLPFSQFQHHLLSILNDFEMRYYK